VRIRREREQARCAYDAQNRGGEARHRSRVGDQRQSSPHLFFRTDDADEIGNRPRRLKLLEQLENGPPVRHLLVAGEGRQGQLIARQLSLFLETPHCEPRQGVEPVQDPDCRADQVQRDVMPAEVRQLVHDHVPQLLVRE
jgi:hypothetical protein